MAKSNMFIQYDEIRAQYPDAVIFFRLGDFYELFYEDAINMSRVLDLTLTAKASGEEEKAPMCGIPYHAADTYINKLISLGYKIAICEQLEPAGGSKLVKRDVVRLITPGTVVDEAVIDETKNNYIASVYQKDKGVGVALCELTTGDFSVAEFTGDEYIAELNDFLVRSLPSEIIAFTNYELEPMLTCIKMGAVPSFSAYDESKYTKAYVSNILGRYFGLTYEQVYDVKRIPFAQIAAGALLCYLEQTQKRVLSHINKIRVQRTKDYMHLDYNTRRNLEILETLKDRRKKGALLSVIDKTKTAMGSRLLKSWLQEPLYNEKEINGRLDAVEELVKKLMQRDSIKECLCKITDIERICGRVAYGNFTPKDAERLANSLALIPKLKELLSKFEGKKFISYVEEMPNFDEVTNLLLNAFKEEPPAILSGGGYIKDGFNKELDTLRNLKKDARKTIEELERREREETGIESLKISYNKVIGYFIEINKIYAGEVPFRYTRKQTVANNDRYITEELAEYQEKIDNAD